MIDAWRQLSLAIGLTTLLACGPDIEAICEDFVDDCGDLNDVDACVERGEALEQESEQLGCDAEWMSYLDCVDQAASLCETELTCGPERADVEACGVVFTEVD